MLSKPPVGVFATSFYESLSVASHGRAMAVHRASSSGAGGCFMTHKQDLL